MNMLTRFFSSNPFTFALGVGVGLVGLYLVSKSEDKRNLEKMLKDMEESLRIIEMKKLALIENEEKCAKAS